MASSAVTAGARGRFRESTVGASDANVSRAAAAGEGAGGRGTGEESRTPEVNNRQAESMPRQVQKANETGGHVLRCHPGVAHSRVSEI